ncbi:MAG: 30S ribosomal protein S21 [Thermodesulfobacteriota bacterium]|jgi:ribosomal protein S21
MVFKVYDNNLEPVLKALKKWFDSSMRRGLREHEYFVPKTQKRREAIRRAKRERWQLEQKEQGKLRLR